MDISIAMARILGIYMVMVIVAMFLQKERFRHLPEAIAGNPALAMTLAVFTLSIGLVMVTLHNLWVADWRVVITLMAWLTLIKGAAWLYIPREMTKIAKSTYKGKSLDITGTLSLLLGLFLIYKGFF